MIKSITRYRSTDGKEYDRREDAEEHDAYLKAVAILNRGSGWGSYSPGYDGPMPMREHTLTAEEMFRHRHKLRNIFLDLPEPAPQIVTRTETEEVYRYPFWMLGAGMVIGMFIGVWF